MLRILFPFSPMPETNEFAAAMETPDAVSTVEQDVAKTLGDTMKEIEDGAMKLAQ
jgi:hypothetical protein